jgi:hypothetical protein
MVARRGKEAPSNKCQKKNSNGKNFAHNWNEFAKHLGGNPRKKVLLWPEHRL